MFWTILIKDPYNYVFYKINIKKCNWPCFKYNFMIIFNGSDFIVNNGVNNNNYLSFSFESYYGSPSL